MSKQLKIAILGAGESGTGSAVLAKKQGYLVWVSDFGQIAEKYKTELLNNHLDFEEGKHNEEKVLSADLIIKSPGIPETAPIVQKVRAASIPVLSEIEFAAKFTNATLIGVTGSNGKTTTTLLIHHILKNAGLKVGLAGNVGLSFARQVAVENHDYYVLELSSFQLDDMFDFKADIAVLTNITPDHLDRYDNKMENYVASKFRILQNQTKADAFIYCDDDSEIKKALPQQLIQARKYPYSMLREVEQGASATENELTVKTEHNTFIMTITELALQGKHNVYNSMAASITAKILDVRNAVLRGSMADYKNIEHRLENVGKIMGIEFINDSKATNVNAAWYALESVHTPIVWIVGGVDKGNDYSMLKDVVKRKVHTIVCLGKDTRKIHAAFDEDVDLIVNTFSAKEAVIVAYNLAHKGDTVLLSPACASYDLFKNYADRGRQFKEAIKEL